MNKEYIEKIYEENKDKLLYSGLNIVSANDLEDILKDTIISNFMFDFDYEINANKLFDNALKLSVNNGRFIKITQTESDKARNGLGLKTIDQNGNIERNDLVGEEDFVMLINYYKFIKDNDIYDEFINQNGTNNKDSFDIEKEIIEI